MKKSNRPIIYWFRQDLRLKDLPGLVAACAKSSEVIPVYIYDDVNPGPWVMGAASRWWLHHSLRSLSHGLATLGSRLHILRGDPLELLPRLVEQLDADAVHCSRSYDPWARGLEGELHARLQSLGYDFRRYPGALLFEPESIENQQGAPFKVFTPFWKACLRCSAPAVPLDAPSEPIGSLANICEGEIDLEKLQLLPLKPDWAASWDGIWNPGETGARHKLAHFLDGPVDHYAEERNYPATQSTSKLSAHMHFGEISPREVWHAADRLRLARPQLGDEVSKFLSELGWREFSHHLLYHFPHIHEQPFKEVFRNFPWLGNPTALTAWKKGQTGYPIVDAGMRELWHTGYMHNRVRMIVASFLTKHLLIPWRIGEEWFWDTLVDADLANNASGWQWVAGSGADASPYFRIFNPTLQGEKFDKGGEYVRLWVPELSDLPNKYIHSPSNAPIEVLAKAGVQIGTDYPAPIVNHSEARQAALAAYGAIKVN